MTNFEKWLKEILTSDPHYMVDIVCYYYDTCCACPCKDVCKLRGDSEAMLTHLQSIAPEYEERTK